MPLNLAAYVAGVTKEAILRRQARSGRRVKGREAMATELDAAGRNRQNHPGAFSYPKGQPVKAAILLARLLVA